MDRLIELIASRNKIPQMATRATFINPYTIGSPIRDIQIVIRCKNYCSDIQETVRHKLRRWNEGSRRKIPFLESETVGKRHRRPWCPCFAGRSVVSCDNARILTGNVEIALGIKRQVKGVIDSGIHLGVAFYEDVHKVVLSIFVERALELQDFAVFEIRVDDIQILIRPEYESAKLTKLDAFRKTLFV